jgi:hypothetical protein
MGVKVEYYDKLGKLHRVLNISDIKQVQGFWTRGKMVMENVQTKHKTILTFSDLKFDLKIDGEMFNVAKLEKGLYNETAINFYVNVNLCRRLCTGWRRRFFGESEGICR